jgi:hypothetical protein
MSLFVLVCCSRISIANLDYQDDSIVLHPPSRSTLYISIRHPLQVGLTTVTFFRFIRARAMPHLSLHLHPLYSIAMHQACAAISLLSLQSTPSPPSYHAVASSMLDHDFVLPRAHSRISSISTHKEYAASQLQSLCACYHERS